MKIKNTYQEKLLEIIINKKQFYICLYNENKYKNILLGTVMSLIHKK